MNEQKRTPLDRELQREIIEFLSANYPKNCVGDFLEQPFIPDDHVVLLANLEYLESLGYIDTTIQKSSNWAEDARGVMLKYIKANAPAVDLIEHDGGISALIEEIENAISNSSESMEVKKHALSLLRDFAITGKDELIKRLITSALDGSGNAVAASLSRILS